MREIVLDTETTGLDPLRGDRLVEIGCVEMFNRMPTGQTFHRHLNPERDMPAEAFAVREVVIPFSSAMTQPSGLSRSSTFSAASPIATRWSSPSNSPSSRPHTRGGSTSASAARPAPTRSRRPRCGARPRPCPRTTSPTS